MTLWNATDCLTTGTYDLIRTPEGEFVKGVYVRAPSSTIKVEASIQPATGRQLQLLPEGFRGNETLSIYTEVELYTQDSSPSQDPDRIVYRGEEYKVIKVSRWEDQAGDVWGGVGATEVHYESLAARIPVP